VAASCTAITASGCDRRLLSDGLPGGMNCSSCHGSNKNMAPPRAVNGSTSTSEIGVGAHQSHVVDNKIAAAMPCDECHPMPRDMLDHPDPNGGRADVVFGALASQGGVSPIWDLNRGRCANTYCHGATLRGAETRSAPVWTRVNGSQVSCTSCHGNPPGGDHPTGACETCHGEVVGPGGIIVKPALHVNGKIEVSGCTVCHGTNTGGSVDGKDPRVAPPKAVNGATATTDLRVGAHQAHLLAGKTASAVLCTECHVVPGPSDPHPDGNNQPGQVVFGPLAKAHAAQPIWDRNTARCSNTYCHGATLSGAAGRLPPLWIQVDGSQLVCTGCHGNPPAKPHPTSTKCDECHGDVVGPGGIIRSLPLHVNGTIEHKNPHPANYAEATVHGQDAKLGRSDCRPCHGEQLEGTAGVTSCDRCHQPGWRQNCTYCHGGTAPPQGTGPLLGAPPPDLSGNVNIGSIGVGTHTEHCTQGDPSFLVHRAYPCTECHINVTDVLTPGHMFDATPGVAEVVFAGGISPAARYNRPGCSNVYCHGTGRVNADEPNFAGTLPDGKLAYSGCGQTAAACHPFTSLSTSHGTHRTPTTTAVPAVTNCRFCHFSVASSASGIANPDLHVDGQVAVGFSAAAYGSVAAATGSWNSTAHTCSQVSCHTIAPVPPPEPAPWRQ
jgi:predicted CxxxxCH...CXXCH cytochrome family protein